MGDRMPSERSSQVHQTPPRGAGPLGDGEEPGAERGAFATPVRPKARQRGEGAGEDERGGVGGGLGV